MIAAPVKIESLYKPLPRSCGAQLRRQREEALEHLISVLEAAASLDLAPSVRKPYSARKGQSQLARLRMAHAAYAGKSVPMPRTRNRIRLRGTK